ncbi:MULTISPECIES: TetR/AcrR family transcriptional regulator [unclassified Sphingomonas]|jgi:AcrR family transcriptional regulator|uniref:TetR/AcrR family transcriptional regulator n=1 Tax=unclassified Sphingomonas TaxID=196159 RepID=UPI00082D49D6|nr:MULTISPECIES: TetR family transcriptional regulator [unclassified Sphingomonas]MCH4893119.1 TetR family transcriptional regulator [Sphingomonas sp. SFZ2018-12]
MAHASTQSATKPDLRRAEILEKLADHMLAAGLSGSSLRAMARAVGTSDRMLLYYFRDKTELVGATLEVIAARLVAMMEAQRAPEPRPYAILVRELSTSLLNPQAWPYMRLWLELASLSALGDPVFRAVGEQIGRGFLEWGTAQLDSPTPEARAIEGAKLLVTIEGLALLTSIGLDDVCRTALDAP